MKTTYKLLISTNLTLAGMLIILAFNLPEIILRFVLVGELPDGTTLLSPDTMLAIVLCGFILTIIFANPSLLAKSVKLTRSSSTKFRLPKHRYTSL